MMMQRLLNTIRQSRLLIQLTVVAYFSVLTIAYTYPLILQMAGSVVGEIGDNIYFVWLIGWYQKALFTLGINPFFHPGLNHPAGWNLATTDTTPAMSLLGLPGSLLFGPTWGYNFAILASFVLAGWCMYLAVKKLTASSLSGLITGTLFAFSPYRWIRYKLGHLSLLGTFWFPLYFVAVAEFLTGERRQWRWLVASALLALGIGLSAPYYLYMGLIITAIFALTLLVTAHKTISIKTMLARNGTLWIALLAATLIAMAPYLLAESEGNLADRSLDYASFYSASPLDFFLPFNFYLEESVWNWAGRSLDNENALYLGVVCLGLAILAWWKRRELRQVPLINAVLVTSLAAAILAMGIYLRFQDTPWVWQVPEFLQPIVRQDTVHIPLPGYFLFLYMPFFAKMRVMSRFGVYTLTLVALLAGLGCAWLFRKYSTWRYLLAGVLLVCSALDVYQGVASQFARVEARPVDFWLAQQPGNGAVAQFPFSQVVDQNQTYNTLIHGKPFIGGFFNANQPQQYQQIKPVMDTFPDAASVALLKELGFQYILVDSTAYPDFKAVQQRILELGLVLKTVAGSEYVFTWP
jgi:hypothetical protein